MAIAGFPLSQIRLFPVQAFQGVLDAGRALAHPAVDQGCFAAHHPFQAQRFGHIGEGAQTQARLSA